MRQASALVGLLLLLAAPQAWAQGQGEMMQTISDLGSQTADKERLDTLGATRVEINEIRTWLSEATNAVKEDEPKRSRRLFERVRAQLLLIDELIKLSLIEGEVNKLTTSYELAQRSLKRGKEELSEKQAKVNVLKHMNE